MRQAAPHMMELPRRIVIGEQNIANLGRFLADLVGGSRVSLVSGYSVRAALGDAVEGSLEGAGMECVWHMSQDNGAEAFGEAERAVRRVDADAVVGVGGGRSVDIAKMTATTLGKPYVSVPTAASHDGMVSPFVSVRGDRPHSLVASSPLGVFVDLGVIRKAPSRLLASGCGDLIANLIAVRDWQLGHKKTGEYYGRYSASLALMSANMVMENAGAFARKGVEVRLVVEALISAGVAACIAGSSRPCSGAEHLFSHALDQISPGRGLHGEKCGIGSIMMANLHGMDWEGVAGALRDVGAPTTAADIGVGAEEVIRALRMAQGLRPERYTILKEAIPDDESARRLAAQTGVI